VPLLNGRFPRLFPPLTVFFEETRELLVFQLAAALLILLFRLALFLTAPQLG